jgi:protease-4
MAVSSRFLLFAALILMNGCIAPNVYLFSDGTKPFQEVILEGDADEKVLFLSIDGTISDSPRQGLLRDRQSPVQQIVSRLRRAEKDEAVKAVVLKINSPGGTVTGSDIIYHELAAYKKRAGIKVVAAMMDVAASGGYYVALPADRIVAHPTTITGSIGVLFLRPNIDALIGKIGLTVDVSKSGEQKDMGSPFRKATPDEERLFQDLTDRMGQRFMDLVRRHRDIDDKDLAAISSARIFMADEAKVLGLVDEVGYVGDAVDAAIALAGLPESARLVVYRSTDIAEDTVYNSPGAGRPADRGLIELGPAAMMDNLMPGFYYLWLPAADGS